MTSIILLTHNGSIHLDQFLSQFFGTLAFKGMDLTVIDRGSSDNIRAVLQRYATLGFIRFIQCKRDDPRTRLREIADQKTRFSGAVYIDINTSGLMWYTDFPVVQNGPREKVDHVINRLEAYFQGYSPDHPAHPDVPPPSHEQIILFVLPDGIDSKHGYQVQQLARMLASQGASCTIAVPEHSDEQRATSSEFSSSSNLTSDLCSFLLLTPN